MIDLLISLSLLSFLFVSIIFVYCLFSGIFQTISDVITGKEG